MKTPHLGANSTAVIVGLLPGEGREISSAGLLDDWIA